MGQASELRSNIGHLLPELAFLSWLLQGVRRGPCAPEMCLGLLPGVQKTWGALGRKASSGYWESQQLLAAALSRLPMSLFSMALHLAPLAPVAQGQLGWAELPGLGPYLAAGVEWGDGVGVKSWGSQVGLFFEESL